MTFWVAGMLLGLAGSAHCVMMCGPLVLTVARTLRPVSRASRLRQALTYHAGRIGVYLLLAVPIGMVSEFLAMKGLGRVVSVAAGVMLAAGALSSRNFALPGALGQRLSAAAGRACVAAHTWLRAHPAGGPALAGAVNGLLPCGLVYAAITAAAATGSASGSVALMFGFGCGTLPALFALNVTTPSMPVAWRPRLRQLTPAVLVLIAALLIIRGLAPSTAHQHEPVQVHDHTSHP